VAGKIAAYLHGEISLAQLVDWAESAIQDGESDERDIDVLRSVVARLTARSPEHYQWKSSAIGCFICLLPLEIRVLEG